MSNPVSHFAHRTQGEAWGGMYATAHCLVCIALNRHCDIIESSPATIQKHFQLDKIIALWRGSYKMNFRVLVEHQRLKA